jgi:hypothetical protein
MEVDGFSWSSSVYDAIRQFHQANGFDPNSQYLARHLGIPLFDISGTAEALIEHGESMEPAA